MSTDKNFSVLRYRIFGWLILLPLLIVTSICLLKYAGWSAVVSAYTGLPKEDGVVRSATHAGTGWFWGLIGMGVLATSLTAIILPLPSSEDFPPGMRETMRVIISLALVIVGTAATAYLLVMIGHHMR